MSVRKEPHYTLPAAVLAGWIESQPDQWWSVDGDPRLTSVVDFPCPSDELAPAIRKLGMDLLVYAPAAGATAQGQVICADRLNELADRSNWRRRRELVFCWVDSEVDWLLVDDEAVVEK